MHPNRRIRLALATYVAVLIVMISPAAGAQPNAVQLRPLPAVRPHGPMELEQIVRPTLTLVTIPQAKSASTPTEYGDMQLLDLLVVPWSDERETRFRWGIGPYPPPMPMVDAWTTIFTAPGTRTAAIKAQSHVITGPRWRGTIPADTKQIKSPIALVWILKRAYSTAPPQDYAAVHKLQHQITLVPLASYGKL